MCDKKKEVIFVGNVKVIQGDIIMIFKSLVVFYDIGGDKLVVLQLVVKVIKGVLMQLVQFGLGGSLLIKWLEVCGNVVVIQKDQVVIGDIVVFDIRINFIIMFGGFGQVVLIQCKNVLCGDCLMVDMIIGVLWVEFDNGWVQVLLLQGGSNDCGFGKGGGGLFLQFFGGVKLK